MMGALALAYPVTKMALSLSGAHNYLNAANHLLHGRVKKATVSSITGTVKLSFTVGVAYLALSPLWSAFEKMMGPPTPISDFEEGSNLNYVSRILRNDAYTENSSAEKIAEFCSYYFKDYPVSSYQVAEACVLPLSENSNGYKDWVLEGPVSAAYRLSKSADAHSFQGIGPLGDCTKQNILENKGYSKTSSTKKLGDCEKSRLNYLKAVLELSGFNEAKKTSNMGCFSSSWLDQTDYCDKELLELS